MSGIFGIYNRSNRTINTDQLKKMASAIAHRGPDGSSTVQYDHIGLGHSMFITTPEAQYEQLPFTDPQSRLVITADARIDNRDDLITSLNLHDSLNLSDSQIILYAYLQWGTDGFRRLIGDFSFAIWDPILRQLICARDYIGIKSFYFHNNTTQFIFSSEIKQLAEHPQVPLTVNEGMVGEYLSCSFCSRTETLFTNINRLAAGHYLIATAKDLNTHKYWDYQPEKRIYYKNKTDYTEHFLEIFEKAVASRLRCNGNVSAELSGGLDSSCVVGMANNILKRKTGGKKLQIYSLIFPGMKFDEKEYIDAALGHNKLSAKYINGLNRTLPLQEYRDSYTYMPPNVPNLSIIDPLFAAASKNNSRVVLSGVGGDQCFTGSGYPYIDFLQDGEIKELLTEFHFRIKKNAHRSVKNFAVNCTWPLLPYWVKYKLTTSAARKHIPPWLTKDFLEKTQLQDRIHNSDPRLLLSNLSNAFQMKAMGPTEQYALEMIDTHRASRNIESRHPFLDQRLVEYSLAIPDYTLLHHGYIKAILRHPQNQLIPRTIRTRRDKAEFSYLINRIFLNVFSAEKYQHFSLNSVGWINDKILNKHISNIINDIKNDPYTSGHYSWEIWFAYALKMWYNMLH